MTMVDLARVVRFMIPLTGDPDTWAGFNTFGCWPSPASLGVYGEVRVVCRGEPDPTTGYLVNISEIDRAVRTSVLPFLWRTLMDRPGMAPAALLPRFLDLLRVELGDIVAAVEWRLSPYHTLAMSRSTVDMVLVRETFEFAAAHRLHCRSLSEEENRRLFGKCNNPLGHGHNYHVEVAVRCRLDLAAGAVSPDALAIERVVDEQVIRRFDHKNLDLDTAEFARINSSVENIARVCHDLLRERIAAIGGELASVTVRETEKTSCTYPAALGDC